MKFEISYSRTVQPEQYESIRIEYRKEFDIDLMMPETALKEVRGFVLKQLDIELMELESMKDGFY